MRLVAGAGFHDVWRTVCGLEPVHNEELDAEVEGQELGDDNGGQ